MATLSDPVDFAIITIIDEELNAVKNIFGLTKLEQKNGRNYYTGTVKTAGGNRSIVLAKSLARSNTFATELTSELVEAWKPKFVIVVGIAGGVYGREEIQLGDVVVANDIEYSEIQKLVEGKALDRKPSSETISPIGPATSEPIKTTTWHKHIKEKRPDNDSSVPKLLIAPILTTEKILGDQKADVQTTVLQKYDRAVAIEMESWGVSTGLYGKRLSDFRAHFVVIRGISDYCNQPDNQKTRDSWKNYAAESAASFAFEFINNVQLNQREIPFSNYIKGFKSVLSEEPGIRFELTFSPASDSTETKPIASLIDYVMDRRKTVLKGQPGAGKSTLIRLIASSLIEKGIIPVILNLKDWQSQYSGELTATTTLKSRMDVLLKASVHPLQIDELMSFQGVFLIVDGLNEIAAGDYGEEGVRKILSVIDEYVHDKSPNVSVLCTDRLTTRSFMSSWGILNLNPLSPSVVEKVYDDKFGKGEYSKLEAHDKELFRTPFFLDYAIRNNASKLGSEAKALELFLTQQLNLTSNLDLLAKAVFETDQKFKSPSFDKSFFAQKVGETLMNRLKDSGTLLIKGNQASFDHQLKRDYLASRYLAHSEKDWESSSFDVVTFESNSIESLTMVLEQISDPKKSDMFLRSVYDWNWPAAIICTERASSKGVQTSKEIEAAMLALVAQKLFDPVQETADSALKYLQGFKTDFARKLIECKTIKAVFQKVNEVASTEEWFLEWRSLFAKDASSQIVDEDIFKIKERPSLVGWTVSNMLKRFKITHDGLVSLRAVYKSLDDDNSYHNAVRWRVVHTLGAFPDNDNVSLLFHALGNDHYHWTQYGAARSLVEIAARTNQTQTRLQIIDGLKQIASHLKPKVIEEIRRAVCFDSAPTTWVSEIIPLLVVCKQQHVGQAEIDRWTKIVEDFKKEQWRQR